jgi:hypothetical protein
MSKCIRQRLVHLGVLKNTNSRKIKSAWALVSFKSSHGAYIIQPRLKITSVRQKESMKYSSGNKLWK